MIDAVVHEITMRWADLDRLNHVNNVVYVGYAAEARAMLGPGVADATVRSSTVRYLRPLQLSTKPVVVVSTLDGPTLTQRIHSAEAPEHVVAEVVTELGDLRPIKPHSGSGPALAMSTRRSDLDSCGDVVLAKLFELFQETRILHISTATDRFASGGFVVGTVSVEQARPVTGRPEPYDAHAWFSRVGAGSITIDSELADGATVLARSSTVLVGFDMQEQRSRRLGDDERAVFEALVSP